DRERLPLAARRTAAARKSGDQVEARGTGARATRCDRDYFALELSVFDSCDGNARGIGGGERGGAEALGVYFSGGAGVEVAAACGRRSRGCFSGADRRWGNRCGADRFRDRQVGV